MTRMKEYFYEVTCRYYDMLELDHKDTDGRNEFLNKTFKKYNINSVFDLTCGTGAQAIYLLENGYSVKASDYSKGMIDIANQKLRKKKHHHKFIKADMRTVYLGEADAVISMFNAIGHLSKNQFRSALRNVKRNLKPNGYYIFDIYNSISMDKYLPKHKHIDVVFSKDNLFIVRYCKNILNKKTGILTTKHIWHIQNYMKPYKELKNIWDLQLYTYSELKKLLEEEGFEILELYGDCYFSEYHDKESEAIYLVTRKKE